jgi:SAM-dependent methyltransferase
MGDNFLSKIFRRLRFIYNVPKIIKFQGYEIEYLRKREKQLSELIFSMREGLVRTIRLSSLPYAEPKLKKDFFNLSESLEELQRLAPRAFEVWTELFTNNDEAYSGDNVEDSCSVKGNFGAEIFKSFASIHLRGAVLDIGCGPISLPLYLEDYPIDRIYGIDPIMPHENQDFHFMQNIAEFLPWEDASFDTAIIGTSFDHILLLDKALNEIKRVLKPHGTLLIWVGFIEGSKKYDPYAEVIEPVDKFHLFHFDKPWFEEMMDEFGFEIIDFYYETSHHFYSFGIKPL